MLYNITPAHAHSNQRRCWYCLATGGVPRLAAQATDSSRLEPVDTLNENIHTSSTFNSTLSQLNIDEQFVYHSRTLR